MSLKRRVLIAACLATICSLFTNAVLLQAKATAIESISTNAISVSPAITSIQLRPQQSSAAVQFKITNDTTLPLKISLSARDFGALNESGTISLFSKNYNPKTNPHSLQSSVTFPHPTVELASHATQTIDIAITNTPALAAGGHFGAVLFSPIIASPGNDKNNVAVHSSVASLVFLITAKGGTEGIDLLPFNIGPLHFSLPKINYIVFRDTGNTQITPRGQLTLFGPSGQIVSTTVINQGSGLVLPGYTRLFQTTLPFAHDRFAMPGLYRMELQYKTASGKTFSVVNRSFLFINLLVVIPGLVVLFGIVLLLKRFQKQLASLIPRRHQRKQ